MKARNIKRSRFEVSGWRVISLAHGQITWPDGRLCRFNVRLQAKPGTEGDVELIAEDLNRVPGSDRAIKRITLQRGSA